LTVGTSRPIGGCRAAARAWGRRRIGRSRREERPRRSRRPAGVL